MCAGKEKAERGRAMSAVYNRVVPVLNFGQEMGPRRCITFAQGVEVFLDSSDNPFCGSIVLRVIRRNTTVFDASQFHYGGEVEVPEFRAVVTLNYEWFAAPCYQ